MDTETETAIEIIMVKTTYTEAIAKQKLSEFNGNIKEVVDDFFKPNHLKTKNISLNQNIYKQMREKLGIQELPEQK